MRWSGIVGATVSICAILVAGDCSAQSIPQSLRGGPDAALRVKRNSWTVGVAGGLIDGTYMRLVDEIAKVIDDGDNLRVLPIVSYGAASNLDDLLYLRGVDVAITQSDVFEYFRTERRTPHLAGRVNYILRLPASEIHVLARPEIHTLQDLRGKNVNFGPAGSGSSLTGTIVFQRLGIPVRQTLVDNENAMQQLRSGEVDALVRVIGKPVEFFNKIPPESGLHLVPIPYSKEFADYYLLSEFNAKDYPGLVSEGQPVETIAVPTVLAVFNWPSGTDRYRRVKRFVERLFASFDKLQKPPFHPKWRDLNIAATVPGWDRLPVAEKELVSRAQASEVGLDREFEDFVRQSGVTMRTRADREALYQNFLSWRERQAGRRRP
jgi:TRAP-type uncharacterized transport system substrate-binding protein